jgi:hypothetical protein
MATARYLVADVWRSKAVDDSDRNPIELVEARA